MVAEQKKWALSEIRIATEETRNEKSVNGNASLKESRGGGVTIFSLLVGPNFFFPLLRNIVPWNIVPLITTVTSHEIPRGLIYCIDMAEGLFLKLILNNFFVLSKAWKPKDMRSVKPSYWLLQLHTVIQSSTVMKIGCWLFSKISLVTEISYQMTNMSPHNGT